MSLVTKVKEYFQVPTISITTTSQKVGLFLGSYLGNEPVQALQYAQDALSEAIEEHKSQNGTMHFQAFANREAVTILLTHIRAQDSYIPNMYLNFIQMLGCSIMHNDVNHKYYQLPLDGLPNYDINQQMELV